MIGIIGALQEEIEAFESALHELHKDVYLGMNFTLGKLGEKEFVIVRSGVGKVNAAMAASLLISHYKVNIIFSTGTAGGIRASKSTTVIASATVQHDFFIEIEDRRRGQLDEYDFIEIPCSKELTLLAEKVSIDLGYSFSVGVIATGDCFVSDKNKKEDISREFNALACDMESAAIGQVCYKAEVPFLSIRTLSDSADDNSINDYYSFKREAALKNSHLIMEIIKRLK